MRAWIDNFKLIMRGVGVIHKLSPYNLLAKCVRSVSNAALPFVNLYMSAAIVNALVARASLTDLFVLVLLTLVLNLALTLISKEMDAINYRKWNEFYLRYNLSIGEKAQSLPYDKIEDEKTHLMIKNVDDAMKISNYGLIKLHSRIPLFVENLCKVLFSLGLILSAIVQKSDNGQTMLQRIANTYYADGVLLILIGFAAFACIWANKRNATKSYDFLGHLSKRNRIYDYYLDHYLDSHKAGKDIRLYRQDRLILDEIDTVGEKNGDIVDDMNAAVFHNNCLIVGANFGLTFYTYFYVGLKAMTGVFAVGSILKYCGGVLQFATAFSAMMDAMSQLQANGRYLRDYFAYMDLPSVHETAKTAHVEADKVRQECCIEVEHVSFRYPGTDEYALKDVSFVIRPGDRVAIVGQNGSGKTTMIKLICRLYEPTEGVIRCNGIDIREYDINQYMALLSVVFQDFKLFSFTLGQNVATDISYDRVKVENCLKKVGLEKRLEKMADGLDTYMYRDFDKNGVEISGGEAQKIAMARAIYKDAPLVILDEPTAALDPIAEADIYVKFDEISGDKTTVFISHRLSSCRFCDNIIVFANGKVVQQGKHEVLVSEKGSTYEALWEAQAQYYK